MNRILPATAAGLLLAFVLLLGVFAMVGWIVPLVGWALGWSPAQCAAVAAIWALVAYFASWTSVTIEQPHPLA